MEDSEKKLQCENCKKLFPESKHPLHEAYCIRNIRKCQSCDEYIEKGEMEGHIQEKHVKKPCKHCNKEIDPAALQQHEENICTQRPVFCEFCKNNLPASDISSHKQACGARTEPCEICKKNIQKRDLTLHPSVCTGPPPKPQVQQPPVVPQPSRQAVAAVTAPQTTTVTTAQNQAAAVSRSSNTSNGPAQPKTTQPQSQPKSSASTTTNSNSGVQKAVEERAYPTASQSIFSDYEDDHAELLEKLQREAEEEEFARQLAQSYEDQHRYVESQKNAFLNMDPSKMSESVMVAGRDEELQRAIFESIQKQAEEERNKGSSRSKNTLSKPGPKMAAESSTTTAASRGIAKNSNIGAAQKQQQPEPLSQNFQYQQQQQKQQQQQQQQYQQQQYQYPQQQQQKPAPSPIVKPPPSQNGQQAFIQKPSFNSSQQAPDAQNSQAQKNKITQQTAMNNKEQQSQNNYLSKPQTPAQRKLETAATRPKPKEKKDDDWESDKHSDYQFKNDKSKNKK